jgi:hypothetical protein
MQSALNLFRVTLHIIIIIIIIIVRCQTLLEDLWTIRSCSLYVFYKYYYHFPSYSLGSILSMYIWFYSCLIMQFMYFYCYDYLFSLYVYV